MNHETELKRVNGGYVVTRNTGQCEKYATLVKAMYVLTMTTDARTLGPKLSLVNY